VGEVLAAQGHEVHVLTTDVGAVQAYYEFGFDRVAHADQTISGVPVKRLKFSGALYRAGGWQRLICGRAGWDGVLRATRVNTCTAG